MEPRRDLFDADRIQRRADVGLLFGDVCSASMPDRCRYGGNHGLVRCGLDEGDEHMTAAIYARKSTDQVGVEDRKSTRLNSSHDQISYAVFCLKKKTRCVVRPT